MVSDTTNTETGDQAGTDPAFDAIMAEASQLEGQPAPGAPVVQAGPSTNAADLLAALQVIRVMAEPLPPMATWPDYKVVWSDGVLQQSADNLGAIFDRMGWTMGGVMEKWGPYIGLAAALGPAGLATYQRVKIHQAEQEAERRRSTPQKAP
jgi:hypothetical protein